ncbi:unknown [Ruminococcus sp. CAG:379]|nr:unknown [Ruminococcus sp. CAG:379]
MRPESVVRILTVIGTVTGYIGEVHCIASEYIVHSGGNTVDVLCILGDIVSISHYDRIVYNEGVRTPLITVNLDQLAVLVIAQVDCISKGCGTVRNTIALFLFLCNVGVSSCGDAVRNSLCISCIQYVTVQVQSQSTQTSGITPVERTEGTGVLAAFQAGGQLEAVSVALHIGQVGCILCSSIQLTCCPVEVILYIGVAVSTAADCLIQRSIQFGVSLCSSIAELSLSQELISIIGINILPQTSSLCSSCNKVQSSCSGRGLYDTDGAPLFSIVIGTNAQTSPLMVVELMEYHVLVLAGVSTAVFRCIIGHLVAGGNNHFHHPVHLDLGLIQNIRDLVSVLRNYNCAGVISPLAFLGIVVTVQYTLVHVVQGPYGNTAVYNVFTVVACIVPAALTVHCTTALVYVRTVSLVGLYPFGLDVCGIRNVTCNVNQIRLGLVHAGRSDVLLFQINTGTVLIEVVYSISQNAIVNIIADLEGIASLAAAGNGVSTSGGEIREIQNLNVLLGIIIVSGLRRSTGVYFLTGSIQQRELLRSCAFLNNSSCLLLQCAEVTNLVYTNLALGNVLLRVQNIVVGLVVSLVDQRHVVELQLRTSREAIGALVLTSTAELPCPLTYFNILGAGESRFNLQGLVCSDLHTVPSISFVATKAVVPYLTIRRTRVTNLGINLTTGIGSNFSLYLIGMTSFQDQTSVTELAVPTGLAAFCSTTRVYDLDVVCTTIDVKLHLTGTGLTDVPR